MENTYCQRHKSHNFCFTKKPETRIDSSPSSNPRVEHVNLYLKCDTITDDRSASFHHPDTPSRTMKIIIPIPENGDTDLAALENIYTERNGRWPLPDCNCRPPLVTNILTALKHEVESVSLQDSNKLDLLCEVVFVQDHTIRDDDVTDWITQQSLEASVPRMVPASESSIKSLRRAIIVDDDGVCESCSVCFEDFLAGSEVLCMPCSHVYHQDCCIGEWLRRSHYCPNCRYEMPTE